jgi:hypothetical protein
MAPQAGRAATRDGQLRHGPVAECDEPAGIRKKNRQSRPRIVPGVGQRYRLIPWWS